MKAEKLGWLSVILASTCCVVPLLAVSLGLGSIGLGSFFGQFEPWLDLGGVALVAAAWFYFLRERRRVCTPGSTICTPGSTIRGERRTIATLSVATVLVLLFAAPVLMVHGLPSKSAARVSGAGTRSNRASTAPAGNYLRKVLAVKGMSCEACAPGVKRSLVRIPGVRWADVSFQSETATVEYDPAKASPEQLVNAIKSAGYDAKLAQ